MQRWSDLRRMVLDRIEAIEVDVAQDLGEGDREAALEQTRALLGAVMAIGLERAAEMARALEPTLRRPGPVRKEALAILAAVRDAVESAPEPHGRRSPGLGLKVLVVEDDAVTRRVVRHTLEEAGCEVEEESRLAGLPARLLQGRPDALILDLHLPDGNGAAACRELRQGEGGQIPVLCLSADTDVETVRAAFAAGADDFVAKPVRAEDLLRRLQAQAARFSMP